MIFVGVTRFSVYQPKSVEWIASKDKEKEAQQNDYLSYLYDEKRINYRLFTFIKLSLPLLAIGSRGFSYIHVVQYSSVMPTKFVKALKKAEAKYGFLKLVEVDTSERYERVWAAVREYFDTLKIEQKTAFGFFNLDDDDLLSIDYFKDASSYINNDRVGYYISFGRGGTGYFDFSKKVLESARYCYSPKINIGLMAISSFDGKNFYIPKRGSHTLVDQVSPLILDSRSIKFFWIRSLFQDTGLTKDNEEARIRKARNSLRRYKRDMGEDIIATSFPTLSFNKKTIRLRNLMRRCKAYLNQFRV